jgi:hypothetical protein
MDILRPNSKTAGYVLIRALEDFPVPEMITAEFAKKISDNYIKAIHIINKRIVEATIEGKKGIYFDGGNNFYQKIGDGKSEPEDLFVWDVYCNCTLGSGNPLKIYLESLGYGVSSYIGLSIDWE